jgi:hypothetical protein
VIDRIRLHDGEECVRLTNDTVEIVASVSSGPRLLRYGLVNGMNLLGSFPERSTPTALGNWRPRGGHRLWAAPEEMPGSYAPDDGPVKWSADDGTVVLAQRADASGLGKCMRIRVQPSGTGVAVEHGVQNCGQWPVEIAPWALTIMAPGGIAVLPQPRFRGHDEALRPVRVMATWAFTDLTDPRWHLGRYVITIKPDRHKPSAQKIGVRNERSWMACVWPHDTFLKCTTCDPHGNYPDGGVNSEVYVEADYLEIETLGQLQRLEPGGWTWHTEHWSRFDGLRDEAFADEAVLHASLTELAQRAWPDVASSL